MRGDGSVIQFLEVKSMFTQHSGLRGPGPRSGRLLVAAALCALLVAATPATANAERVNDADTVGDMVRYDGDPVPAPDRTLNDISNTTLTHGGRRVAIRVGYVGLKRRAGGLAQYLLYPYGHQRGDSSPPRPGCQEGTLVRRDPDVQRAICEHRLFWCAALHQLWRNLHQGELSSDDAPANPRWMRVQGSTVLVESEEGAFEDDALRDRPITADDKRLKRSERVRGAGCVTRSEFEQAEVGMRRWRVHRIFDTTGKPFGERDDAGFSRWYKQCDAPRGYAECRAIVDYHVGRHGAASVAPGKTWAAWCASR